MRLTFEVVEKNHFFQRRCLPKSVSELVVCQLFLCPPLIPGRNHFVFISNIISQGLFKNQSQRSGFGYRQFIWKVTPGTGHKGKGLREEKGEDNKVCYSAGYHGGQLGPNPSEAPLRTCRGPYHVLDKDESLGMYLSTPITHWFRVILKVLMPMNFQAVPDHELRVLT